jgi:two-component system KDP operon response regulator KdpE
MRVKKNTILVVDFEPHINKMLSIILDASDFRTVQSEYGGQAIRLCASIKPDLMLLDLNLPDMDGKDVIKATREWSQVPIVVVSGRSSDEDITSALDMGADDYIIKPFNTDVLVARIKACLRKSAVREVGEPELRNGRLRIDMVTHRVFIDDEIIPFTPKEYNLLRYFIINRGKMLTHKEILREVWGAAHSDDKQYLRVFIKQIREKIEQNPAIPKLIVTDPGIGYRMVDFVQKTEAVYFTENQQRLAS